MNGNKTMPNILSILIILLPLLPFILYVFFNDQDQCALGVSLHGTGLLTHVCTLNRPLILERDRLSHTRTHKTSAMVTWE